jgi:hypothetical protein
MIQNPFETGHIKNYILAYASVVVIMILFFIASTLFHDIEQQDTKVFEKKEPQKRESIESKPIEETSKKFKMMENGY